MSRDRILIVDDYPENLQVLYHTLDRDYEVFGAKSGRDALKLMESVRPDLVLLDVMMPEMDGFAVCREIKGNPVTEDTPVIFLTALGDPINEMAGFEAGAVDYVVKPFKPVIVKMRVRTQLQIRRQRELLERKNAELEEALHKVQLLSGLLPICMMCKKIRDDQGYWNQLENYISQHSDARFSHGYCPECFEKHMVELHAQLPEILAMTDGGCEPDS